MGTRLLDNYERLQQMPFGAWTAQNNDPAMRGLTSQRRDLTSALRKGIRNARNSGDPEAVVKMQAMGNAQGLDFSGIGRAKDRVGGNFKAAAYFRARSGINEDLTERAAAGVEKVGAMEQTATGTNSDKDTVNPNATAGVGRGNPIKRAMETAPVAENKSATGAGVPNPMKQAEASATGIRDKGFEYVLSDIGVANEKENLLRKNLAGDFGRGAQMRAQRQEASRITEGMASGELSPGDALRQATAIGGNAYSLKKSVDERLTQAAKADPMAAELDAAEGRSPGSTFLERTRKRNRV